MKRKLAQREQGVVSRRRAWQLALAAPLAAGTLILVLGVLDLATPVMLNLSGCVLTLLLIACTYTDLRWTRIPNWATYSALLWGWGLNLAVTLLAAMQWPAADGLQRWSGAVGWQESLLGAGACFAVMFGMYTLCRTGAGDVKLAAAIGALVGVEAGLSVLVLCYLIAAIVVLGWLTWEVGPRKILASFTRLVGHFLFPVWIFPPTQEHHLVLEKPVPLAAFFAAATLLCCGGYFA